LILFADIATLSPLPERKLLVLVNPFSGSGKALHVFQRHVVPMFAEAGVQYQLVVTGTFVCLFLIFLLNRLSCVWNSVFTLFSSILYADNAV